MQLASTFLHPFSCVTLFRLEANGEHSKCPADAMGCDDFDDVCAARRSENRNKKLAINAISRVLFRYESFLCKKMTDNFAAKNIVDELLNHHYVRASMLHIDCIQAGGRKIA